MWTSLWEVRNSFFASLIKKPWLSSFRCLLNYLRTGKSSSLRFVVLPAAELFLESSCNERILHGLILWLIGVFVLSCHVVLCEFLVRMLDALRSGVVRVFSLFLFMPQHCWRLSTVSTVDLPIRQKSWSGIKLFGITGSSSWVVVWLPLYFISWILY